MPGEWYIPAIYSRKRYLRKESFTSLHLTHPREISPCVQKILLFSLKPLYIHEAVFSTPTLLTTTVCNTYYYHRTRNWPPTERPCLRICWFTLSFWNDGKSNARLYKKLPSWLFMALVEVDDQGGISFFGGRKERKFRALLFINPLRPRERKVPLLCSCFFCFAISKCRGVVG